MSSLMLLNLGAICHVFLLFNQEDFLPSVVEVEPQKCPHSDTNGGSSYKGRKCQYISILPTHPTYIITTSKHAHEFEIK